MLKALRNKKTAKKVWIVLAAIIVPAFVLWGSGSLIRSKQQASFAGVIFGRKISLLEYRDALEAVKNTAIMQFGDKFSEISQFLNLESQAWDRLIMLHEARKRKIKASDREVMELIQRYPFFQRNDKFDNRTYNDVLQYVFRTQARVFEEQTRQDIILSKLYNQVTREVRAQDEEVRQEYAKANQEISLYYIAALPADFSEGISPSEQEIQDYFNQNSLEFKQPLSFNLEYVSSDSQEVIKEISSKLKKKEDLQDLAKEAGLQVKETGFFTQSDPVPGIGWSPEILGLVANLKAGEISPPIPVDKNYYLLALKERKETYIPEFTEVKDKVKETLIRKEAERKAKQRIDECRQKLTQDLEKSARECGLKFAATDKFKFGGYIEGIGASDALWTRARELKEGEASEVIGMPSGFYIIKVKEIVPIDESKFAAEKEDFSRNVLSSKKQEFFVKFVEELKKKASLP